jgi:prolyl oligopeptidase
MASRLFLAIVFFATIVAAQQPAPPPAAPVRPVTNDYFGTSVVDNYRYMENLKDPEVAAWIKSQSDYAHGVLESIPGRAALLKRLQQLDQTVPRVQPFRLPGNVYLILKRLPTEDVAKLYLRQGAAGSDKLLVNPENVKLENQAKGKNTIQYFAPSLDNKYVAVGIAPGGSERDTEMRFFDVASGRELGDVVTRAWGANPNWLPDNRSLVYSKLQKVGPDTPVTEIEQKVRGYLHVLGTDGESDPAVFGYGVDPSISVDPTHFAGVTVLPNTNYAIGFVNTGVDPNSAIYIEPLGNLVKKESAWKRIADFDDDVSDAEVHGDDLYILTFKNALRYKLLRTSAAKPDLANAETIVAPSEAVVSSISLAKDAVYVQLMDGGINRFLRVSYGPHPKTAEVALPFKGTAFALTDPRIPGALIGIASWTKAFRIYSYDPETKHVEYTKLQPAGPYDNPRNVEAVEVKVRANDGTMVPLSIVYPKTMKRDGSAPTLLDGYGAYGIANTPFFNPMQLAWYEKGGIYAECHVRGGGEYGEEWHLAGKGATKPNTWNDFIACAQYLIDQKYTSPSRLAGQGGSAGGILIGRAITTRPDLFAAAIDIVGDSDTLRSEESANGVPNIPEFGSTKTEAGFKALYEMSAYHHVKPSTAYPAVLLETGYNDPRVDPWQMAKMAAQLQASTSSGKPVLLRVEYAGGHGGIGGTEKQRQERTADEDSFLLWQFGLAH